MKITTKELSPRLWADVDTLFGLDERQRGLRRGILAGEVAGVVAYADGAPVGCSTFGSGELAPVFHVKRGFRSKGVARALVEASLRAMKKCEKRPVRLPAPAGAEPSLSRTGTESFFAKAGFRPTGLRPRVRLVIS